MSRTALPSLALTGLPQSLNLPSQLTGLQVRLANKSYLDLQWTWGVQSGILYPGEMDALRPDTTASPTIQLLPLSVANSAQSPGNLLAELAFEPDSFEGHYPMSSGYDLSQHVASRQELVGSPFAVAAGTISALVPFTLPAGANGVRISVSSDGGLNTPRGTIAVFSSASTPVDNINYLVTSGGQGIPFDAAVPIDVKVDTQIDPGIQVQVSVISGSPNVHVHVSALFSSETITQRRVGAPIAWEAPSVGAGIMVASPGIGVDFTIAAAVANGGAYRLWTLDADTNSNAAVRMSIWNGPSAGGLLVGTLFQLSATSPPMKGRYDGSQVANPGAALVGRLDAAQAGSSVWLNLSRSVQ